MLVVGNTHLDLFWQLLAVCVTVQTLVLLCFLVCHYMISKGVFRLAKAGVGTIFCLQEDSDMAYFNLDINPIIKRCEERGDIKHVRFSIRDFDPFSLRQRLPEAVAILVKEAASGQSKLYIHCTAGLMIRLCNVEFGI